MTINPLAEFLGGVRRNLLLQEAKEKSDGQLLERFVDGRDRLALETLVLRHAPMVWGVCRRTLAHHDAENAFQNTFLVLFRKAECIRCRELVAHWLYRVAFQTARKTRQKNIKRHTVEKQVDVMPEPPTEAHEGVLDSESRAKLEEELNRLPEKYRIAFVLCVLEGKSHRDVAHLLRVEEGTVGSRLWRGREILAQRLARRGLGVSETLLTAVWSQKATLAIVPAALLTKTIQLAGPFAAGETTAAGLISTGVSTLAEGVLYAMTLAKKKAASALIVMAALVMGGGGMAAYHIHNKKAIEEAEAQKQASEEAKAKEEAEAEADISRFGNAKDAKEPAIRFLWSQMSERFFTRSYDPPPGMFRDGCKATFDSKTKHWIIAGKLALFDRIDTTEWRDWEVEVSYSPFCHAWQGHMVRGVSNFVKKTKKNPAKMPVTFADLRSMTEMDLSNSRITDEDLRLFHGLKNLNSLQIGYSPQVTDVGLSHLRDLPNLRTLRFNVGKIVEVDFTLQFHGVKVTEAGFRALQRALPDCTVLLNDWTLRPSRGLIRDLLFPQRPLH